MNSPKFYYEVYKRFIITPNILNQTFVEINTTGVLSSVMWKQLFNDIHVHSVSALPTCEFDVCYLNLDDYSNFLPIIRSLNLAKRSTGIHHFVLSSKSKFWQYSSELFGDQTFLADGRRFYSSTDVGLIPYKLKTPSNTVIREYPDPEGMLLEYR